LANTQNLEHQIERLFNPTQLLADLRLALMDTVFPAGVQRFFYRVLSLLQLS